MWVKLYLNYFFSSGHPPLYIISNTEYAYHSLLYVSQFFSISILVLQCLLKYIFREDKEEKLKGQSLNWKAFSTPNE